MKNETDFEVLKIFGKNVQEIRINKNISLKELSKKTKIRLQYLKKIEKGTALRLSTRHLFKIAGGLKVKLKELLEGL